MSNLFGATSPELVPSKSQSRGAQSHAQRGHTHRTAAIQKQEGAIGMGFSFVRLFVAPTLDELILLVYLLNKKCWNYTVTNA